MGAFSCLDQAGHYLFRLGPGFGIYPIADACTQVTALIRGVVRGGA